MTRTTHLLVIGTLLLMAPVVRGQELFKQVFAGAKTQQELLEK